MNFAILNNNTVKTFNNNVIGFPSSTNDKFILKRENTNGSISYSWIPFQHVSGNVNFTTKNYNTYLTTEKQSINIDSNSFISSSFKFSIIFSSILPFSPS